jgi:prepilin-type N-terminal cleavage/methylation domain-containing protein
MRHTARPKKKNFLDRLASNAFRGFTIIEVIVVVGIIGVLTAVTATSMNIQRNYENAHDATRKQDVNQIQKALTQYYIDNRCLDLQSDWDYLTCNGDVPDKLKPYFSKIPCDPETGEKYYVEFLDKNCKRCDGGCGVCIGLRVLTELKHPKGSSGGSAGGCDEDRGCGVFKPNGHAYNYGLGSNNSCIVPTPTVVPTSQTQPTPTNTLAPIPTATPTPNPLLSQVWAQVYW